MNRSILYYFSIVLSFLILSCNQPKEEVALESEIENHLDTTNYTCTKIVINKYDMKYSSVFNYFDTGNIFELSDKKKLDTFDTLLASADRKIYARTLSVDYTIAFYHKTKNYKTYYVDTNQFKDNIIIFTENPIYERVYIVSKTRWDTFLKTLDTIHHNEYHILDLAIARKLYQYTLDNDLPIINSKRRSAHWTEYDGEFKFTVARVDKRLEEKEIYNNIKTAYPNDKYLIETISRYQMCGSYNGHDCYEEYTIKIICDKIFYEKFKTYTPKSYFKEYVAEIYVLGSKEKLLGLDSIAEKEIID